jgi:hypothetical protein
MSEQWLETEPCLSMFCPVSGKEATEQMQPFDRILGILLFLRSKSLVSAAELARRFGVSTRTIYRDLERLSALGVETWSNDACLSWAVSAGTKSPVFGGFQAQKCLEKTVLFQRFLLTRDKHHLTRFLGVPLYAERGRQGGVRLLPGYFLPPLMFTQQEAIALLLGLAQQRSLRAIPFPDEREIAEKKLLATLPDHLRSLLTRAEQLVGFEKTPNDLFHPELGPSEATLPGTRTTEEIDLQQSRTISIFFRPFWTGTW